MTVSTFQANSPVTAVFGLFRPEGLQFTAAECRLPIGRSADRTQPADL